MYTNEDLDTTEEVKVAINSIIATLQSLEKRVIEVNELKYQTTLSLLKHIKQLLSLLAIAGSALVAYNNLPATYKEDLSAKYMEGLIVLCLGAGGVSTLRNKEDENR